MFIYKKFEMDLNNKVLYYMGIIKKVGRDYCEMTLDIG